MKTILILAALGISLLSGCGANAPRPVDDEVRELKKAETKMMPAFESFVRRGNGTDTCPEGTEAYSPKVVGGSSAVAENRNGYVDWAHDAQGQRTNPCLTPEQLKRAQAGKSIYNGVQDRAPITIERHPPRHYNHGAYSRRHYR